MLDKQSVITRLPEHGDKRHDVNSKDKSILHFLEINTFIPPSISQFLFAFLWALFSASKAG